MGIYVRKKRENREWKYEFEQMIQLTTKCLVGAMRRSMLASLLFESGDDSDSSPNPGSSSSCFEFEDSPIETVPG